MAVTVDASALVIVNVLVEVPVTAAAVIRYGSFSADKYAVESTEPSAYRNCEAVPPTLINAVPVI